MTHERRRAVPRRELRPLWGQRSSRKRGDPTYKRVRLMSRRRVAACVLAAIVAGSGLADAASKRILVLSSGEELSEHEALAGIRNHGAGVPVDSVHSDPKSEDTLISALAQNDRDTAVITLGDKAQRLVVRAAPSGPVVHCLTGSATDTAAAANAFVVSDEVPIAARLTWLKRLLPKARNVGLLFDPATNASRAREEVAALRREGFAAFPEPVRQPVALPAALSRLAGTIDVMHAISDATAFAREGLKPLFLFSFRNKIPISGPTEEWVRAGALFAVTWDFAEVGAYCAAMAVRALKEGKPPLPAPPRPRVTVNLNTAAQLGLRWDAGLLQTVDRVYP